MHTLNDLKVGQNVITREIPGYQSGVSGPEGWFGPDDGVAKIAKIKALKRPPGYEASAAITLVLEDGRTVTTEAWHRLYPVA